MDSQEHREEWYTPNISMRGLGLFHPSAPFIGIVFVERGILGTGDVINKVVCTRREAPRLSEYRHGQACSAYDV